MFSVLSKLKYRINKDINQADKHWDTNPGNDYYFAEICGLKRALDHIAIAEAEELTALDKWAQQEEKKERESYGASNRNGAGS